MSEPFQMRPIYDTLLCGSKRLPVGLFQLHIATAEQLCRLHYAPGSLKAVKRRLKVLVDEEYIQADIIPTRTHGTPFYYTLANKGMRYLGDLEMDVSEAWRAGKEVNKHALFIQHALELGDVIIAAALLAGADPRFYLESFVHERVLKRHAQKVQWTSELGLQTFTLIPDAFLDFRITGTKLHCPVLLEHDRGTEEREHFKRKVRAYLAYLKAEAFRTQFGVPQVVVAFTTFTSAERLEKMRDWTRQVLQSGGEPRRIGQCFSFALLPQPVLPGAAWLEPRWYSAYETDQPEPLLAA